MNYFLKVKMSNPLLFISLQNPTFYMVLEIKEELSFIVKDKQIFLAFLVNEFYKN